MTMSTVFVTQETSHDFTSAESFGDIEFLTKDDFNNVRGSLVNKGLVSEIMHKLKKFDENKDWIIVTGSPYVSAMVFMALGNMGVRNAQVLRWDNRDFVYRPLHLELNR